MSKDIYTEENFDRFAQLFTPYGYTGNYYDAKGDELEFSDNIDINYSNILTKLIQLAGRYCESYASDLFIYWNAIDARLRDGSIESGSHLFGFREMGVDHNSFIFSRADESHRYFEYAYRAIWRLDIEVHVDPDYWWHKGRKKVLMNLYRVSAPSDWRIEKFFYDLYEEIKENNEEVKDEKALETLEIE